MKTDLAREVDEAVARALAEIGREAQWRTYSGSQQTELCKQLQAVTGCCDVGLTSSGTAALEMVLRACRLGPGDEVLLAGYDYPGSFAAIERTGARPALVDIEASSWNLSMESLVAAVRPECRVLIASHLHGHLQPMAALGEWCRQRKIWLIQDACQALGATIGTQPLGMHADATVLSFGGTKLISAGRGGSWATNNPELAQRARLAAGAGSGAYELSELQAAAILAQLPFLERLVKCCRDYFAKEAQKLATTCPDALAPWLAHVQHTAFYQAGWIFQKSHQQTNDKVSAVRTSSEIYDRGKTNQARSGEYERAGVGSGFPGFHRRSARRCRISGLLQNTQSLSQSTVTVHYRAALEDVRVADLIARSIASSHDTAHSADHG